MLHQMYIGVVVCWPWAGADESICILMAHLQIWISWSIWDGLKPSKTELLPARCRYLDYIMKNENILSWNWHTISQDHIRGSQKGGFQKGNFGGERTKTGTRLQEPVFLDPPKPERGHKKTERRYKKNRNAYIRQNHPFTKPPFGYLAELVKITSEI